MVSGWDPDGVVEALELPGTGLCLRCNGIRSSPWTMCASSLRSWKPRARTRADPALGDRSARTAMGVAAAAQLRGTDSAPTDVAWPARAVIAAPRTPRRLGSRHRSAAALLSEARAGD